MIQGYRVRAKIAVQRFKWLCFRLFLVLLGGVIGVSFFVAHDAYKVASMPLVFSNVSEARENTSQVKIEGIQEVLSVEERIKKVAKEMRWEDVDFLIRLAECESSLNPYAKNDKSSARGLFQILDMHGLSEDARYNVETATAWTIEKLRKDGSRPWQSSAHCWAQ